MHASLGALVWVTLVWIAWAAFNPIAPVSLARGGTAGAHVLAGDQPPGAELRPG
jgi:hypothetical protein